MKNCRSEFSSNRCLTDSYKQTISYKEAYATRLLAIPYMELHVKKAFILFKFQASLNASNAYMSKAL